MRSFDFESGLRVSRGRLTRRQFLWLASLAAAGAATGCATNPVTGQSQLMLVSEEEEVKVDRQYSPMQISADYGQAQDRVLNDYVDQVGRSVAARSHRANMPYSFRVVNANYINAYAFPGGTIACTRAILLNLDNEAELAALMGHEIGHVSARHTASAMSKGMLTQMVVGGLSILAGTQSAVLGDLAGQLGSIGAGALLASYSRDNERQADALGTEYLVQSGYGPNGMVGLMEMLQSLNKSKPSSIELMFATHPMSDERYHSALDAVNSRYRSAQGLPLHRERYMDHTARLRAAKPAIEEMQKGDKSMGRKKFGEAGEHYERALKMAPNDYAGLISMATCQLVQKNYAEGQRYAERAKSVYPQESRGHHLSGFAKLSTQNFDGAYQDFSTTERLLPGNPQVVFFKGYAQEKMDHRPQAASEYRRYLQQVREGDYAKYANQRLREWGYAR